MCSSIDNEQKVLNKIGGLVQNSHKNKKKCMHVCMCVYIDDRYMCQGPLKLKINPLKQTYLSGGIAVFGTASEWGGAERICFVGAANLMTVLETHTQI